MSTGGEAITEMLPQSLIVHGVYDEISDSRLFTLPSLGKGGLGWNGEIMIGKTLGSFIFSILL